MLITISFEPLSTKVWSCCTVPAPSPPPPQLQLPLPVDYVDLRDWEDCGIDPDSDSPDSPPHAHYIDIALATLRKDFVSVLRSWIPHWKTFPYQNQEQRVEYLSRKVQRWVSLIYSTLHHISNDILYDGSLVFFPSWKGKFQVFSPQTIVFSSQKALPKRRSSMLPFIQTVLHHPDLDPNDVDHHRHEQFT